MRKNILLVTAALMFALMFSTGTALAVPALPNACILTQADGTTFEAIQWGDEHSHGWQTIAGYSIVRDKESNSWYYAQRNADGYLVKSDTPANEKVPKGLSSELRPAKNAARDIAKNIEEKRIKRTASPTGTLKVPILLIDFPDCPRSKTKVQIENVLFGAEATGAGNLQEYYKEVSRNQLTVTPGTGIGDWVTADKLRSAYGANDSDGNDIDPAALIKEAIQKADANIDFSQYAVDGTVPVVVVIHSGYDESLGKPFAMEDDIWAHNWTLSDAGYGAMTVDGVTINNYTVQSELTCDAAIEKGGYTQAIGVFAHELGHAIGCPDTYDTSGNTAGAGNWDLMAGGSWGRVNVAGDTPAQMSAFIKYYLGWVQPKTVTSDSRVTVGNLEDNPEEIYLVGSNPGGVDWSFYNHSGTGEYFLVENRQAEKYDAFLPGSGLLIWHVDETASLSNDANAVAPRLLELEQADGYEDLHYYFDRGDDGDPWPGSTRNTIFDNTSIPGSKYHSGYSSGVSISQIDRDGKDVSFKYQETIVDPYLEMILKENGQKIAEDSLMIFSLNASYKFTMNLYNADGVKIKKARYKYESSDPKVCKVSKGKLKMGKTEGTATITIIDQLSGAHFQFGVWVTKAEG